MKEEKLDAAEKTEVAIQAGLQLIPYIGSSLSTLYFSTKQEKRFKRIETFYSDLSERIDHLNLQLPPVEVHDEDKLMALIEELNEKIEKEHQEQKRDYFKKFLLSCLLTPTLENYDERQFFLTTLSVMNLLECEILSFLYSHNEAVIVGDIFKPGVDQYAIVGALGKLSLYGFTVTSQFSLHIGGSVDNTLSQKVKTSNFGRKFVEFCLN
ncbi:hypothetical protein [Paenibacillus senegalensis]|uniref:hypothetical protein n=1 Tax=Paenibacillus senegalensis TaxID=1465766 RepID=UPI0002881E5A|nr:hypothetical protein [Paenibacillus senegalensis]